MGSKCNFNLLNILSYCLSFLQQICTNVFYNFLKTVVNDTSKEFWWLEKILITVTTCQELTYMLQIKCLHIILTPNLEGRYYYYEAYFINMNAICRWHLFNSTGISLIVLMNCQVVHKPTIILIKNDNIYILWKFCPNFVPLYKCFV